MEDWCSLREKILSRIKPGEKEEKQVHIFIEEMIKKINKILEKNDFKAVAEIHGSVAHGTWISGEQDLDVFIVFDQDQPKNEFSRMLKTLKNVFSQWIEAYAEHPYIQVLIDEYNIDIVPCFKHTRNHALKSSTDRSPLHTEFIKENFSLEMMDDVRILKQFMKTINVYGAEIKIGGFSGYLCELLISHYNSFINLIQDVSEWRSQTVIQINSDINRKQLTRKFNDNLIVIDPVDHNRNVASAVTEHSYLKFIAAAERFIKDPGKRFFTKQEPSLPRDISEIIQEKGTKLFSLMIEEEEAEVPDSLWGQLIKTLQVLSNILERNDFNVFRSSVWSNEKDRHIFLFELESVKLGTVKKIEGPPVLMKKNSDSFIKTHIDSPNTVSGPWIENTKWWFLVKRKYTDAKTLLKDSLTDGGLQVGVSKNLAAKIQINHKLLTNLEIHEYLTEDFKKFLYNFLMGRPEWFD